MSGLKPSETSQGRAWLSNFIAEDQPVARVLVDSLHFVQLSTIRPKLHAMLQGLTAAHEIEHPAMVVAALSIEDLIDTSGGRPAIAFESFGPGDRISATPGSEGFIGHLIRDLFRADHRSRASWLPSTASLDSLRQNRCRSIVIVTDYSGSGTQLAQYAKTFVRNPTVRSWRSGRLVRIYAVAFAATPFAMEGLGRLGSPIDGFWTVQAAPSFSDRPWTPSERRAVEELCQRYARPKARNDALGYRSSRGLFATDVSVPNNLPAVLRQRGDGWHPFFDGRTVTPQLALEMGEYISGVGYSELMTTTGQLRLASVPTSRNTRAVSAKVLAILALLNAKAHTAAELAGKSGDDLQHVERLLASLNALGLIDERRRLTALGREELRAGKRAVRHVEAVLSGSDEPYYPTTMR